MDAKDTKPQVNKNFPLLIFFRKILYLCTQNVFRCNKIEFLSTIFEYIYLITDDFQAVCLFFFYVAARVGFNECSNYRGIF